MTDEPFPRHWEADVVVADGGVIHLRPIQPSDAEALVAFHGALSSRTRYLRYFSAYPRIPERDLIRFTTVDHHDRVALIALLGGEIIAVGRYERTGDTDDAEVAFVVADPHQGRGIGSVLLEHLAAAAREVGLRQFHAVVLAENNAMIRVFREAGYQTATQLEYGEVTLTFAVDATALTESVMREREQRAEARSIGRLLHPTAVAVVGASNDEGKVGNAVFRNLLRMGFAGTLYPVNSEARQVFGVRAYPSVLDVPDELDLAVIAVPAASVAGVVEQCAARGVRGLIVISGGFGENGDPAGVAAQRDLVTEARAHGLRVVGPNCLGVVNTDRAVSLNASLAPLPPLAGRAGFFCQSGALGVAVLGEASRRGLGVSTFVSAGNRADVSGNDLLQYWETDPATDIALLYLESFGNPRKFARLARRLGRRKPIVAVKSGRGSVVAGLQHTTVEVPSASVQALFEASGVIRVESLAELFDVALLLTTQPLPTGRRVGVVGNSTALAVLVTDALVSDDLVVARLTDVGVDATPVDFEAALRLALADPDLDALVAVFTPPLMQTSGEDYAIALRAAASGSGKPVVSTFLGFEGVPAALAEPGPSSPMPGSIPSYTTPERAVRALSRAVRYSQWRTRPAGRLPQFDDLDRAAARALVTEVLDAGPGRALSAAESTQLLRCYGIDVTHAETVSGLAGAQSALIAADGPVALRTTTQVRLHLADAAALAEAWASLGLAVTDEAIVQAMAPRGVDVVLDVHDDRSFGALVSFGVGGVATELLGDRAYAAVPLTVTDAEELIRAPKAAPLLAGYGGGVPASLPALTDLALRLSVLADEVPELVECSIWAAAGPTEAAVLSASAHVASPTAVSDAGPRRLSGL